MRLRELSISVATILSLSAVSAFAGPKGTAPKSGAPKTTTASAPKTTTTHGAPKTTTTTHGGPKATTTHGSPKTTTTHGAPKTATTAHGNSKKSATPTSTTATTAATSTTTTSNTTSSSTGSTGSTSTTTQLNPIAQKISSKSQLNSKVTSLLPSGMTLNEASKGFKNQGQFIAALHVSQNLGIPFADLKTAMTGITPKITTTGGTTTGGTTTGGTTGGTTAGTTTSTSTESQTLLSLGQAIKKLRPNADSTTAETTATKQATVDLSAK